MSYSDWGGDDDIYDGPGRGLWLLGQLARATFRRIRRLYKEAAVHRRREARRLQWRRLQRGW